MEVQSAAKEPKNMIALVVILAYGLELAHGTYQVSPNLTRESKEQLQHYQSQGNIKPPPDRRNIQAIWTTCPLKCRCLENEKHFITTVDCSNSGLREVPALPPSSVTVYLQGNSIKNISCDAFDAVRLQTLNLSRNPLNDVRRCIFRNQTKSLKQLHIACFRIRISEPNNTFRGLTALTWLELSGGFFSRLNKLIPGMFSDLVNLNTLDLSSGGIERLEADTFVGLRKLRNLYLDFNIQLSYQSGYHKNAFRGLKSLEVLRIKGSEAGTWTSNHCEDYPDVALSTLVSLKELHLDPCINAPGPGFRELTNLTVLDMVRNCYYMYFKCGVYFQWPSDFFKNIRSQKELFINISGCDRTVGDGLFQPIPNIYSLDVSYNRCLNATGFAEMTKSLINSSITYLYASNISLPYEFFNTSILRHLKHTNLKTLVMRHNRIENSFYFNLSFLPHTMEDLDFSDNCFDFQEYYRIKWPQSLRTLRLSDQTHVTRCPISLSSLTIFNINDATMKQKWLGDLSTSSNGTDMNNSSASTRMFYNRSDAATSRALSSSVLSSHPLLQTNETYTCPKCWHITVKLPKSLEYFYINRIYRYIDKCIPHVTVEGNVKLRYEELAENNLMEWYGPVENIPSLEVLDLSQNKCKHISLNFFKGMENLQILKIQDNALGKTLKEDREGLVLAPLAKLRTLNLSSNLITTLHKHLHNLSDLRVLDLSHNFIQYLPYNFFFQNVRLEVLNLSNNILDSFRPSLSRVKNMSRLDLSSNTMAGLSEDCCENLKRLKSINPSFTVNLQNIRLLLSCDFFPFLSLLIKEPDIFENVEQLMFRYPNGTMTKYNQVVHYLPEFGVSCFAQFLFIPVLVTFFLVLGTILVSAVLYYNRWKLRYLYYIGQRRMHIGNTLINYHPAAQIYIIYDEDEPKWRRFLQQDFLPRLRHENIDYILSEVNFPSGDLMSSIAGAVVGTNKTLVLLSKDIFIDHYREIGVNLGIMKEINTRSQVLVPVWLERVDLATYPAEIESFLQHQEFRCLAYEDNDMFWQQLLNAINENT